MFVASLRASTVPATPPYKPVVTYSAVRVLGWLFTWLLSTASSEALALVHGLMNQEDQSRLFL
jgi:hypothetical protein